MSENLSLLELKEQIPVKEHWKLTEHGKTAFVDIETTGLSRWTNQITVIGIYDGSERHIFIKDKNLHEAKEKLKEFDIIVTFNGKQFDLPFIEEHFNESYDCIHLDLRYMLKEFGLKGGLKAIEKQLGILRDDEVANMTGYEAVKLWKRYEQGDQKALGLLVKYNCEDIVNLKYLLNWYIEKKKALVNE